MLKPLILLAPYKILKEHSESDWISAIGPESYILTCASEEEEVKSHFKKIARRILFFKDFNDNPYVEIKALELAKEIGTDCVIALSEVDLLRAARVKDALNPLQSNEEAVLHYRDKFLMKQTLSTNGIKISPMQVVRSSLDIMKFIQKYNYPVVLKPRDGRGSSGVKVIHNHEELKEYLSKKQSSTFYNLMVEKYLKADLINVNGLYIKGSPVIISPVLSMVNCLDYLAGETMGFLMLSIDNPLYSQAVKLTSDIIEKSLPEIPNMLFHLEAFITEGELVVCEIACRLGGAGVNIELEEAFGINPRFEYILSERGAYKDKNITQLKPMRLIGQIDVPPKNGTLHGFPTSTPFPYVNYYQVKARKGENYSSMRMTNAEIVCALVEGKNELELKQRFLEFSEWVDREFDWS